MTFVRLHSETHENGPTIAPKLSDVKSTTIKTERVEVRSRRSGEGRVVTPAWSRRR